MSTPKRPDMRFMSDAPSKTAVIGTISGNRQSAGNAALTDLALVLLNHGMPDHEVRSAVDQIAAVSADYRAGKLTEAHMGRVCEIILATALSRVSDRRAA